jgi:hypothetical protein
MLFRLPPSLEKRLPEGHLPLAGQLIPGAGTSRL